MDETQSTDVVAAHEHCGNHREEILASDRCGCFYCLEHFDPASIKEWVNPDAAGVASTAICPRCGIDSVIGSASSVPITREFLERMHAHWFRSVS